MLLVTFQRAKKKHVHKNIDKDQRNLGIITFELFNLFFRANLSRCSSGLTECLKQAICNISDSLKWRLIFVCSADKLLQSQKEGKCFVNFHEGDLKFPPTYKYNPGTNEWDTDR